jgi:hypothetical protein
MVNLRNQRAPAAQRGPRAPRGGRVAGAPPVALLPNQGPPQPVNEFHDLL